MIGQQLVHVRGHVHHFYECKSCAVWFGVNVAAMKGISNRCPELPTSCRLVPLWCFLALSLFAGYSRRRRVRSAPCASHLAERTESAIVTWDKLFWGWWSLWRLSHTGTTSQATEAIWGVYQVEIEALLWSFTTWKIFPAAFSASAISAAYIVLISVITGSMLVVWIVANSFSWLHAACSQKAIKYATTGKYTMRDEVAPSLHRCWISGIEDNSLD